jgi:hypothetical protein
VNTAPSATPHTALPRAQVRAAAADKPGHAAYAEALITHYAAGGTFTGEPTADGIRGLSQRAATALSRDIAAIHAPATGNALRDNHSAYRAAYHHLREADRLRRHRAKGQRRRWEEDNPLAALLTL